MPLSFDQNCLHLIFDHTNAANPIPARKYGKLQNIVSSVKDFYVCLFVLLLCFTFLSKTNFFSCNSLCNVNSFIILNILQKM